MNPIKKFYCRSFQWVFGLALHVMPYRSPRVLDSVADIPALLTEEGITSVLVVTDSFLHQSGKLEPMKQALTEAGIRFTVYDEAVPNPTIANVETARSLYVENACQGLIGFGGGSSIDCAKAIRSPLMAAGVRTTVTAAPRTALTFLWSFPPCRM